MEYRRSITAGHSPFTRYLAKAARHQTGRHHHTRSRPISPYKVKNIVCPSTPNSEKVHMWFWCNFNDLRIFLCPNSEHDIREGCEEQACPFLFFSPHSQTYISRSTRLRYSRPSSTAWYPRYQSTPILQIAFYRKRHIQPTKCAT